MEEEEERTTAEREMEEGVKADVAQMPMAAATIAEENFMMLLLVVYAFGRR
jgi:hypothetical protein